MIKSISFKNVILLGSLIFINACADTRVSWKAMDMGCVVPSANIAFVEISQIQSTGTTRDIAGIAKYVKYVFKKSILDVEDRCKHTKVIIDALKNADDYEPYKWKSPDKNTAGKIVIFSSRDYAKKVCRDYYTYISNGKKIYGYRGTACLGTKDVLSPYPDLLSRVGHWHFYEYYPTQVGSNPIKLDYLSLQFSPPTPDIRRQLFKFRCSKEPWKCR